MLSRCDAEIGSCCRAHLQAGSKAASGRGFPAYDCCGVVVPAHMWAPYYARVANKHTPLVANSLTLAMRCDCLVRKFMPSCQLLGIFLGHIKYCLSFFFDRWLLATKTPTRNWTQDSSRFFKEALPALSACTNDLVPRCLRETQQVEVTKGMPFMG